MQKRQNSPFSLLVRGLGSLLLGALLLAVLPTDAEAKIYEDTLRLHILANSDSEEDQAQKLRLRNKILEKYGTFFAGCAEREEAEEIALAQIEAIREDAERWLAEEGCAYPVRVSLSTEWYDTRKYENFTLPAGYYRSLRVVIGAGEGHNWWCVMYPPLCLDMALDDACEEPLSHYSPEEVLLIDGKETRVRFKTLEILSAFFEKKG